MALPQAAGAFALIDNADLLVEPNKFTSYAPSSPVKIFAFENPGHRFIDPEGGSIPNGDFFGIAMQQDAWDWTATSSTAISWCSRWA